VPNVLKALRAEIKQMARHETNRAAKPLREQLRGLRRTLTAIERRLSGIKAGHAGTPAAGAGGDGRRARFAPSLVRQHRSQLGLSRKAYAKLLGVSSLSVYFWETGRTKPRRETVLALQDLKKKGVRELRLAAGVAPGTPAAAKKSPTRKRAKAKRGAKQAAKPAKPAQRASKPKRAARSAKATKTKPAARRRRVRRARRGARPKAA
jgi:DNA-binding XRE family transcriptional regulator